MSTVAFDETVNAYVPPPLPPAPPLALSPQLLQRLSEAAGIELQDYCTKVVTVFYDKSTASPWNPLTSDADALRLAVKLRLDVTHWGGTVNVNKPGPRHVHVPEHWGPDGDVSAATRRAIVRAAAQIGGYRE